MGGLEIGKVSIIIPGRCEEYFQQTIDSCLDSAVEDIEVIAVVDGYKPDPPLVARDSRVKIIQLETSIGQRAGYNLGVKNSTGKYVMKIDAHAMLSPGFDKVLKEHCPDKTTVLPEMRRLDVKAWKPKRTGKTLFMHIGLDMYCHFWPQYKIRGEAKTEYPEVMTGQGSCWFTTREWNDHIGLLDEAVGSWGNVGIEVSLRTWLCGGRQIVNKKAWQAHWFRRNEGGFTYPMSGRQVARAHKYTRENYYFNDHAFKNQTRPFKWVIEKFAPIPGWEAYMTDEYQSPRVIVYYTDSKLEPRLAHAVRKHLGKIVGPIPIISVSQEPLKFGKNIVVGDKPRCVMSMFEQMLVGLKAAPENSIVYLCEHDIFYHPSHFSFLPKRKKHACFNLNRYHHRFGMDTFLKARGKRAYSQCVAYREMLIEHIETRIEEWKTSRVKMHIPFYNFSSDRPNVDIRHGGNLTPDGHYKRDWLATGDKGVKDLPGWGGTEHFRKKVGFAELPEVEKINKVPVIIDTAEHLRKKFRRSLPQMSPIRCIGYKRTELGVLFNELGFKRGAEIGVREGVFSRCLCESIKDIDLLCVDIWEPYSGHRKAKANEKYADAQKRLKPFNAKLIKMSGLDMAKKVPNNSLDFVYIDAAHRFDDVMQDIIVWSPKVRKGGIVSGHDYYRGRNNGVVPAVDAYTYAHQINEWFVTDEKEASFFWVKN